MRTVIVGGVAGGMSAATRLRRLDEKMDIIVLDKGPYVSFANCGLPYYIGGEINEREKLIVQTPQRLEDRFNLDVRVEHEVIHINTDTKEVVALSGDNEEVIPYDKLVLSPGATPIIPTIAGMEDADNLFTLRSIPDVDGIMNYIDEHEPKKAVVIGAGFIGTETAENLTSRGIEVTIIEKASHVLPSVDAEMAVFLEYELKKNGVHVISEAGVIAFTDNGKVVHLDNGVEVATDMIILSVGVRPDTDMIKNSGITVNDRGGILVDENYETNVKDIYAVGDAIVVKQIQTGEDAMISLASPANRQGRQVADVIAGLPRKNKGSLGTAIVRVFSQVMASTGLNETQLIRLKKDYAAVHIPGKNHAGYFPGSSDIFLKLLFDRKTGAIYGAQAIGRDGVDKRIDVISTAILGELTVFDLPELELSYAPPFGSAKDIVNMAGYAAMNIIEGMSENIQWHELRKLQDDGAFVLDVRDDAELKAGRLSNATHIPLSELRERMNEIPTDNLIIVSCHSGLRSYLAERILKQNGFNVRNLDGAFYLYSKVLPEEIEH
ncbi:FAD-dependent oxidoreductase [Breznakia pachnodae]|uniref:NADPH-dependent 2,4-dienoyl-CoA reductase/sulfur reductase-like enzyme/rhodanese-related sulfurtransferase n=1 Tax=Breznakia pachnodae TaxID=265178 RepID=A0ABU0E610_9FIRM|nr:FAD-dependent oxidoreductase [Breznakia pachnodae]MDQ0362343.1 NADPH-dependent 2,4-dienoyl-CoA reductase/sulfur reductase-like enzyme/rhodanese-related sulfurtransferase [Breznakia pachnodae]